MLYAKCRKCTYVCRCCASPYFDNRPGCSECPNNRSEFEPALHIIYCPLDGKTLERPLMDINGNIVKGE